MLTTQVFAQSKDPWMAFESEATSLIGFKDTVGNVRLNPQFERPISAKVFDGIIAVSRNIHGKIESYYLTKSGKKGQQDNLYIFDNAPDCENEGFIRFRDHKTGKVGILNRKGKIVVPAEYDDLTKVRNGLIIALKNNPKGGKSILMDTTNHILIRDFPLNQSLDFYSIQKTEKPNSLLNRVYFHAENGGYYSFLDYKKTFKSWLKKEILPHLSPQKLSAISIDSLLVSLGGSWKKIEKHTFVQESFNRIKSNLVLLKKQNGDHFILIDGLNREMYGKKAFEPFFNNCGEPLKWKYPLMDLVIVRADNVQNHFEFLRTDKEYILVSVTMR